MHTTHQTVVAIVIVTTTTKQAMTAFWLLCRTCIEINTHIHTQTITIYERKQRKIGANVYIEFIFAQEKRSVEISYEIWNMVTVSAAYFVLYDNKKRQHIKQKNTHTNFYIIYYMPVCTYMCTYMYIYIYSTMKFAYTSPYSFYYFCLNNVWTSF